MIALDFGFILGFSTGSLLVVLLFLLDNISFYSGGGFDEE